MKKSAIASVVLSSFVSAAHADTLAVDTAVGFESRYVFRGVQLAETSIQPSIQLNYGNFYGGAWFNLPVGDDDLVVTPGGEELDFYAGYGFALNESVHLDVGFTYYTYPDLASGFFDVFEEDGDGLGANTVEIFAGLSFDTALTPTFYVYRDFMLDTLTIEGSVSHSIPLAEKTSFDLGAALGYVVDDDPADYLYGNISADLTYALSDHGSLAAGVRYGGADIAGGSFIDDSIGGTLQSSGFWWGIRECHDPDYQGADKVTNSCPYRSKAEYPFSTRGKADGKPVNDGFMGDSPPHQTQQNFERLTRADFAYTPFVPAGEENAKKPDWLNDPRFYHNRGDSFWIGESVLYGDFGGLDDLQTEDPRVLEGMIDIYKDWIAKYRLDGFRVDTARHVNPEFWRAFNAAMLEHAAALGIPNFYIFGEGWAPDAGGLARFTHVDGFPAVLDFAFQATVQEVVADGAPAIRFADLFAVDPLYKGGEATAARLPVFVGNHDKGRFAMFVRQARPDAPEEETIKRIALGHAMMFFLRGVPVIYYGAEQGFNGDGNDQASREDMFPSQVDSYNDNDLFGADATTASSNFDKMHPLYRSFAQMARLYHRHEPLRRGAQLLREAEHDGGLLAVSRLARNGGEYLVVFNASDEDQLTSVAVDHRSGAWKSIHGECERRPAAPGSYRVSVPAFDYIICKSNKWSAGE